METRNGKWVNVDYSQRVLDENYAGAVATAGGQGDFQQQQQPQRRTSSSSSLRNSSNSNSSNGTINTPLDPRDENYIQITVSEPVKQGEGMNAYISYKISTTTNRPQFTKSAFSVIRRYSDFIWLHGNLSAMYPGVVVPPLPEKLLVGRFSPEFIESRRRALQVFLHRCSLHPELQHSEHLTTFLDASDDALAAFKADPNKHPHSKGSRGSLFQWIDDTVTTISTTLGASSAVGGNLEKTSADLEVDEMMNYVDGLEPIMTGLHKHANGLTKRAREIADGLFEFGVSYSLLGKSEENPSLQEALREIASCADKLSLLAAEFAEKEAIHFEEPILDYIRLVGAVKAALHKRNDVRGSYAVAVADLEAKSLVLDKMMKSHTKKISLASSSAAASDEKFHIAEGDLMKAQQRVDDAKLEFDIVTERVMREVERFKRDKLADFKRIVLDYVQMQIAYSKKVEDEWSYVIPKLAQIRIDSPSDSMQSIASSASGGPLSLIQENYIPSTNDAPSETSRHRPPAAVATGNAGYGNGNGGGDLSNNLLSLSLDEDDHDEEQKASWDNHHSQQQQPYQQQEQQQQRTRVARVQVRSAYNPDLTM